jgi:hypothetical protein
MGDTLLPLLLLCGAASLSSDAWHGGSYLCQSAYAIDEEVRVPTQTYTPQAGDIFLATDQQRWSRAGHWLAGGAGLQHSGIIFTRSNGKPGLLEAGPFNSLKIEILDPCSHMHNHVAAGDRVWIRCRRVPLTWEQSERLTAFAEAQEGKPFALWRMLAQVTPLRYRTPARIYFLGRAHGTRDRYFCSELVMESCCAAGLHDPATARPMCTYPRDLFLGTSTNWYLKQHLDLNEDWYPPARWLELPCD